MIGNIRQRKKRAEAASEKHRFLFFALGATFFPVFGLSCPGSLPACLPHTPLFIEKNFDPQVVLCKLNFIRP